MFVLELLVVLSLGAEAPSAEEVRFFETKVRPVLAEHCFRCHGEKKQWAELRLDSRAGLLKGGESGLVFDPAKPLESRLLVAILKTDPDLQMPPKDEPQLTERQIADLGRWIERGAPYPLAETTAKTRHRDPEHWAFQPPRMQPPPRVNGSSRTMIDDFVLAALEAKQLSLSPPADNRTLIRRLTFDLTGLPPRPEEVDAFLRDENPDAFERAADRLLAAPTYGERWGRHWLDVARYADSNGLDENICHGNAWRYRDYVVAAFNADKPYDRFVREQLAGDLLPFADDATRRENLIAVGFLAIGPKVLAEVDEAKMQMDIIDEQLDTVGRAFLGLTLGCARCHDHKFDPIDTVDYYGLAGVFKSTRTMEHYRKIAKWHENVLPSDESRRLQSEYEAKLAAKKAEIDAGGHAEADLKKLRDELTALQKTPPDLPSAMGAVDAKVEDVAVHIRGNPLKLGDIAPRHTPVVLRGPSPPQFSATKSGRDELSQWMVDPQHPLTARVFVNRIWQKHFGRGLVPSVDNFGLLGEKPTHPELLDALATLFVADWSTKRLHREIVCSATYRQASSPAATTLAADPDNRLFSRAAVRRLEAEAIRDALLAAGDELDGAIGGPVMKVKNREFLFDHTSKDMTDYTSRRRSLYLPVVRNNTYDLFTLFDFPDAATVNGERTTTTVAPQALAMLNSPLVGQSAAAFARRLLAEHADVEQRLNRLREIAFGRPATAAEVAADRAFLADVSRAIGSDSELQAWTLLCQTALAANEFIYVK